VQISEIFKHAPGEPRLPVHQRLQPLGRTWQVIAQADIGYRKKIEDLHQLKVKE